MKKVWKILMRNISIPVKLVYKRNVVNENLSNVSLSTLCNKLFFLVFNTWQKICFYRFSPTTSCLPMRLPGTWPKVSLLLCIIFLIFFLVSDPVVAHLIFFNEYRDIYNAKYYGKGGKGNCQLGKKLKLKVGGKNEKWKGKRREITLKRGKRL